MGVEWRQGGARLVDVREEMHGEDGDDDPGTRGGWQADSAGHTGVRGVGLAEVKGIRAVGACMRRSGKGGGGWEMGRKMKIRRGI